MTRVVRRPILPLHPDFCEDKQCNICYHDVVIQEEEEQFNVPRFIEVKAKVKKTREIFSGEVTEEIREVTFDTLMGQFVKLTEEKTALEGKAVNVTEYAVTEARMNERSR